MQARGAAITESVDQIPELSTYTTMCLQGENRTVNMNMDHACFRPQTSLVLIQLLPGR